MSLQWVAGIAGASPQTGGQGERVGVDRVSVLMISSFVLMTAAATTGKGLMVVVPVVVLTMVMTAWHQVLLRWSTILGALVGVILFVPIGRYSLPVNLPFEVELYRVFVALVITAWVGSLLIDPHVRLRRSPFDRAIAIIVGATLGSVIVNGHRVVPLESAVLKSITFFLSFVVVYYFIVSVVRSRAMVENITKLIVGGVATVAFFAALEQRSRFNVFDHVAVALPFLQFDGALQVERNGLIRAVASSQHPIALGVLFAMTIPLSLALAFGSSRRWWMSTALLAVGSMSSVSRTPILVSVAAGIVLLSLRPKEIKGLLPLLLPLIVVIKLALPGSLATVVEAFAPPGGIVAQQTALPSEADPLLVGGRVRQLRPMLSEASRTPLLGEGYGTRQVGLDNPLRNAPILDNQWLNLLLEIGIVGVAGWVMLISGALRKLGRASRRRAGPEGWLGVGFAASIIGFGVGMFTYDSLAFIQVAFMFWIVLALSASLLVADAEAESARGVHGQGFP